MTVMYWQCYITIELEKRKLSICDLCNATKELHYQGGGKKIISDPPKPHNGEQAFRKLVSNLALCGTFYIRSFPTLVDSVTTFETFSKNRLENK